LGSNKTCCRRIYQANIYSQYYLLLRFYKKTVINFTTGNILHKTVDLGSNIFSKFLASAQKKQVMCFIKNWKFSCQQIKVLAILASVTDNKILLFIFVKHSTQIMERNIETLHQKYSSKYNPTSNQLQKS